MKNLKVFALVFLIFSGLAASDRYFEISKQIDIFVSLYKEVDRLYVDEIDHSKVMRSAIDAMLKSLDPYTVFYSASEIEDFRFLSTGKYGGIGAQVGNRNKFPIILEPYQGFPADKAGLIAGDVLIEIDGKDVEGKTSDEISALLKGEPGTELSVLVKRIDREPFKVEITREEIKLDNVTYSGMLNEEIGYVRFDNFRENAAEEVKEHLNKLKEQGMKQFVLDVRGNPGGLLLEAVNVVNLFVKPNELVVYTKGKDKDSYKPYKTYKPAYDAEIPIVVLIDEGSASASEIVSGALQDLDRAVVLGSNSFGKGLVQVTRPISFNTQLKVTTSKYYMPSGRCIQRLDYAHKELDGSVPEIPDSLKKEFKTSSGRKVYDGAGIDPDLDINGGETPEVIANLVRQNMIFDFATEYKSKHSNLPSPTEFEVNDALYESFLSFVNKESFKFKLKAESTLKQLEKELALNSLETKQLELLQAQIEKQKKADLILHKEKIANLLRLEIISRYYYEKGKAEAKLQKDEVIIKAVEILKNPSEYQKILMPS